MKKILPVCASETPRHRAAAPLASQSGNAFLQANRSAGTAVFSIDGCACGGGCPRCQHHDALEEDLKHAGEATVRSDRTEASGAALVTNGKPAFASLKNLDELYVDGDGDGKVPTPAPAPRVPIPQPPPPQPVPPKKKPSPPACPTDLKINGTGNLQMDADFAAADWLTGFGGFAEIQVSDKSGKDWSGTAIHENLKNIKNTCGLNGACSNANGDGGAKGSTFKVGEEGSLLGLTKLPAKKNTFYDLHMLAMKGVSFLHQAKKPACDIQCEQTYECNGQQIGPTLVISYALKQATIKGDKKNFDVTTVDMNVQPKP